MVTHFHSTRDFRPPGPSRSTDGMSFAEVIVVMGVLAVVVYFLVVAITGVVPHTQATTAEDNLNKLNAAVLRFNQSNWELVLEPQAGSTADEIAIFQSLQFRHPTRPTPGSPFLADHLSAVDSNDEETYRAVWNGRQFQLLPAGTEGTGIDLNRMQENSGSPAFAEGFAPVGAR